MEKIESVENIKVGDYIKYKFYNELSHKTQTDIYKITSISTDYIRVYYLDKNAQFYIKKRDLNSNFCWKLSEEEAIKMENL